MVNTKTVEQSVTIKATPHDVYEALMDSEKHSRFPGAKAVISRDVGGSFTAYDGALSRTLLELAPDERERAGVFLAFQYPVGIPGVGTAYFLRAAVNAIRKHRGEEELDAADFLGFVKEKMRLVDMDEQLLKRSVNEGFSGGEKKRGEVFQMAVLEPKLAILDETDSGLDIDALKIVAHGVNSMRRTDRAFLIITHYQRLLNYIVPDFVHVLVDGRIVKTGGKELAMELEERGYAWADQSIRPAAAAS